MISLRVIAFCQHPTVPQPHVNHKACLPNLFMTRNLRLPSPHAGKAARTDALAAFLLPIGSAGTALDGLNKRKSRKTAQRRNNHHSLSTSAPTGTPAAALFGRSRSSIPFASGKRRFPPEHAAPASGPPLPALFKKLEKTLPPLPGNAPVREQIILPYPP